MKPPSSIFWDLNDLLIRVEDGHGYVVDTGAGFEDDGGRLSLLVRSVEKSGLLGSTGKITMKTFDGEERAEKLVREIMLVSMLKKTLTLLQRVRKSVFVFFGLLAEIWSLCLFKGVLLEKLIQE